MCRIHAVQKAYENKWIILHSSGNFSFGPAAMDIDVIHDNDFEMLYYTATLATVTEEAGDNPCWRFHKLANDATHLACSKMVIKNMVMREGDKPLADNVPAA